MGGAASRRRGHNAERAVVRYLRDRGYPDAHTTRSQLGHDGFHAPGDVVGPVGPNRPCHEGRETMSIEDRKFELEFKTKEEMEEAADKIGLYLSDWQIIDGPEAQRHMDDIGLEPEDEGDEPLNVLAMFTLGNKAFAPHVLDPSKDEMDTTLAGMEVDLDHDAIIESVAPDGDLDVIDEELRRLSGRDD